MIAIHSVVGADDVWGLLPRLKAAGASGILVLPDREDRPVSATRSITSPSRVDAAVPVPPAPARPRAPSPPATRTPGATATPSSAAAPSRTRPSATPPARPSPTSGPRRRRGPRRQRRGRRRPPRRPARPRSGRPARRTRRASSRGSGAPSTRRSTTSAGSPRPSARARPGRRSPPASRSSAAGRRSPGSARTSPAARRRIPSSLVMTVVPARVAGVGRIVVASPADRDGRTNPVLLGAAGLLEVDAFVVAGGAQAIGALAYGLPDAGLAPVDRIVGPGNAWVTAAKIEVCGEVGIDLPAGPSEGMVLAAPPADPDRVAADLITQAEHGPDSPAILVTTDAAFADAVEAAVAPPLAAAARRDDPRRRAARPRPDRPGADARRRHRLRQRLRARAPVGRRRAARADGRPPAQRGLAVRRPVGARVGRRLRDRRQPRPADRRPRPRRRAGSSVETYGKFVQVQRIDRDGPRRDPRDHRARWPRPRACSPIATPSRSASRTPTR